MTEFFIVRYPEDRPLFIDSGPGGSTNQLQSVERGSHTFDLGEPADYVPVSRFLLVRGTSHANPLIVDFQPMVIAVASEDAGETVGAGVIPEAPPAVTLPRAAPPVRRKVRKKPARKKAARKTRARKTPARRKRAKKR